MFNWRIVNISLIVLLIFTITSHHMTLAIENGSSLTIDTLDSHFQKIREKEKHNSSILTSNQQEDLLESHTYLKNKSSVHPTFSKKSASKVNLDDYFEIFRSNYVKEEELKLQSIDNVNLSDVNERGIILKLKEGKSFNADEFGVEIVNVTKPIVQKGVYLVRVPEKYDYNKKLLELNRNAAIIFAEPDYLLESTFIPSDPHYNKQWYLDKISMKNAWDINKGSPDVTIAVLDTGVNANHPDLLGRVLPGYDFVNNDTDASDDHGHGTHIAGIIAANSDRIGISGIDHRAKILPVKVMGKNGGSLWDSIMGIYYAMDQGVDVINMSYGGYQYSQHEKEAITEAYNKGIVLVAAAGNDGLRHLMYPASYKEVISVAATDEYDYKANFSNYGDKIDLSAPGDNIYSTHYLGGYVSWDGTSFSAPIISALAGLVKAQNPHWGPDEIEWALGYSSESTGKNEWNMFEGYGRVNAFKALTAKLPSLHNDASNVRIGAEPLENNSVIKDKMDLPNDLDWFSFQIQESANATIDISNIPNHLDLVGVLLKYEGNRILDQQLLDNSGMGRDEKLSFRAEPGNYYLVIYDYYNHWSVDSYNVELSIGTDVKNESDLIMETEPNDTIYTANHLPFGSFGGGFFQKYEDYDYFEVQLPYNGDIMITTATDRYASLNDPAALLLDSHGNIIDIAELIWNNDSHLKYLTEVFENITPGKYYIVLTNLNRFSDIFNPYIFDVRYLGAITGEVSIPQASLESGTFHKPIEVELTGESGVEIKYTLDGSTPSITNGMKYSNPIKIEHDTTLKAVAIKNGIPSKVVTYEYSFEEIFVQVPKTNVPSGDFTDPFNIELTSNQIDTKIIYTIDGSTPTINNGNLYEKPISISRSTTVKAIVVFEDITSEVKTFIYNYVPHQETGSSFPDTANHWARDEISFIAGKELITGYPNGNFGADDDIKRSEAATIIVRELGLSLKKSDFIDVPKSHWASGYIGAATDAEILTGYGNGKFAPDDFLSREEMATILVRAYKLTGVGTISFSDVKLGSWSSPYIEKLVANKITLGYPDNTFRPKKNITRAEFSVMVARVLDESFR